MADPVALTSVISSAVIAAGSLWFNYRNGREQRTHDAALSFEGRVWEAKSQGLFDTISAVHNLALRLQHGPTGRGLAFAVSDAKTALDEAVAPVEAYASDACREAFTTLHDLLIQSGVPTHMTETLVSYRKWKEEAIDAENFNEALVARKSEKELMDEAAAAYEIDVPVTLDAAERLIVEARKSVRSSG